MNKFVVDSPLESCAGRVNPQRYSCGCRREGLELGAGRARSGQQNYLFGLLNIDSVHVKVTWKEKKVSLPYFIEFFKDFRWF